ncbi:hypothetical protein Hanom_Chr14g01284101 [Helianthus anomalus]
MYAINATIQQPHNHVTIQTYENTSCSIQPLISTNIVCFARKSPECLDDSKAFSLHRTSAEGLAAHTSPKGLLTT